MNLPRLSEAEFQDQVLQLAKLRGWRTAHFRPARTANGWRTAVSADGKGFPDLIMARGERLLVAELKVHRNKPTPEQTAWMDAFLRAGVEVYLWYPKDFDQIQKVLA